VPAAVIAATTEYEHDQDNVRMFRDDACSRGDHVPAGALYTRYGDWCKDNGFSAMNSTNFGHALTRLGHEGDKVNGTRIRRGLVIGTSGGPFDGSGSGRVGLDKPDPKPDPDESRIGKPRGPQQGRVGSGLLESSLDSENEKGGVIEAAIETPDPTRPYGDKTPANGHISTGSGTSPGPDPAPPDVKARVAEYIETHGPASLSEMMGALKIKATPLLNAANELVGDGRATKLDASTWGEV